MILSETAKLVKFSGLNKSLIKNNETLAQNWTS